MNFITTFIGIFKILLTERQHFDILPGLIITSNVVAKADKRLWNLQRLSNLGVSQIDLVDI